MIYKWPSMLVSLPTNRATPRPLRVREVELRTHIKAQGLSLPVEHEFLDDGYSGATLIRPGLEQLRDVIAAGGIDRLSVHCPDRLARNYARSASCFSKILSTPGLRYNFSIGKLVRPRKINFSSRFKE